MWYKNVCRSFFRFVTMHTIDRQTDAQKGLGYTVRCITCSRTEKKAKFTDICAVLFINSQQDETRIALRAPSTETNNRSRL